MNSGEVTIEQWKDEEIALFLKQLGLQQYIENFKRHEIWGDVLAMITDDHLQEVITFCEDARSVFTDIRATAISGDT